MKLFYQDKNLIKIINENLSVFLEYDEFLQLEPGYSYSEEDRIKYIPEIYHENLRKKEKLPKEWNLGNYYIQKCSEYILYKRSKKDKILDIFEKSYDIKRKEEYPSIEELTVAIWEYLFEDKYPIELIEKRKSIKEKYKKWQDQEQENN